MSRENELKFENVTIIHKRFSGDEYKQNRPTFGILLDEQQAAELKEAGWPVKTFTPKVSDDKPARDPYSFLTVVIYWKGEGKDISPEVISKDIDTGKKIRYNNETLHRLDNLTFSGNYIEIRRWWQTKYPTNPCWCVGLNKLGVDVESSDFDKKYGSDDCDWAIDDVDAL